MLPAPDRSRSRPIGRLLLASLPAFRQNQVVSASTEHDQRRVREIFAAVADARPEDRERLLRSWCGENPALRREVDELLRWHDDVSGPLDRVAVIDRDAMTRATPNAGELSPGTRIGQFVVESLLGAGGMGVVYRCRQERPSRVVALKLIRPLFATPSVLRRFEYEAEVLGRLQHPGIASIIEAGTVELECGAQPYVAMEFVDGLPIDRACQARQLAPRDRVAIFAKVCDAVDHAHRRGIIHRDLKPDNILLDDSGQPKILDFGVARTIGGSAGEHRLTMPMTNGSQLIGTLAYMSPEQTAGDSSKVDARADVYGLGATLFEVLTGELPVMIDGKPLGEAIRAILEGHQRRLAVVAPALRGDLETILTKALAVEPERRYATVADFGADLRRWLADEPVAARRPSSLYRILKFAKRRRSAFVGACVAAIALAIGGFVAVRALRTTDVARGEAAAASTERSEVASVLKKLVRGIDPALAHGGETAALRGMLGQIAVRVRDELAGQPPLRAELLGLAGDGYAKLGAFDEAVGLAEEAMRIHAELGGERSVPVANDLAFLAGIAFARGDVVVAQELTDRARRLRVELLGEEHSDVGASLADAADLASLRGENADAESLLLRAIAIQRASRDPLAPGRLAAALSRIAVIYGRQQRGVEALAALDESMAIRKDAFGPKSPEVAESLVERADAALTRHDIFSAECDLRAALDIRIEALGGDHSQTAELRQQLAQLAAFRGAGAEALALSQSVIESLGRSLGLNSPGYAMALGRHGQMLASLGHGDEAEKAYGEALAIFERAGASGAASARTLRVEIAGVWIGAGQFERALPLIDRQLSEDDGSSEINPDDRQMLLAEAADAYARAAWGRVHRAGRGPGAAGAVELAERGIERGRQLLALRADGSGFRRSSARLRLAAALVAHALASWASAPDGTAKGAALHDLGEAESLLAGAHDDATASEASGGDPAGNPRTMQSIEIWTTRLYWLWSKVAPDERVAAELQRWRATDGGSLATVPTFSE